MLWLNWINYFALLYLVIGMDRMEFKLQYYFEIYKDTSVVGKSNFKNNFIKKHGEFNYISELKIMIEKYQMKTYGGLILPGNIIATYMNKQTLHNREYQRNAARFGTKEERERRKNNANKKH